MVVRPSDLSLTPVNRVRIPPYPDRNICKLEGLDSHLTAFNSFFALIWFRATCLKDNHRLFWLVCANLLLKICTEKVNVMKAIYSRFFFTNYDTNGLYSRKC